MMNDLYSVVHPLAYLVILAGCLIAIITALEPMPSGAWHLAGTWLFCGLIPYVVYGSLTTLLDDCTLLTTGFLLLSVDLVARAGLAYTAATQPDPLAAIWLVAVLVLGILPTGVLAGKLLARLPHCRHGDSGIRTI